MLSKVEARRILSMKISRDIGEGKLMISQEISSRNCPPNKRRTEVKNPRTRKNWSQKSQKVRIEYRSVKTLKVDCRSSVVAFELYPGSKRKIMDFGVECRAFLECYVSLNSSLSIWRSC